MCSRLGVIWRQLVVVVALSAAILVPQPAAASIDADRIETRRAEGTQIEFHYLDRYSPAIDELERESRAAVDRMTTALGLESFENVDVWVLPTVADYFELKGEPNRAPEWAIGLSLGDRQTVIVARETDMPGGSASELDKTYVHELAHVAVDVARDGGEVPRWFHEGFALMIAEEWTTERRDTLTRAASTGSLISIADLDEGFPAHHQLSSLAYAQSFHFVRHLRERHGLENFAGIMRQVRDGTPFPDAVEQATGESLASLESTWRAQLTENTSWIALFRDDFAIFFGAALIFVIGWFVRRRRLSAQADDEDDEPGEWAYDESKYPLPGEVDQ